MHLFSFKTILAQLPTKTFKTKEAKENKNHKTKKKKNHLNHPSTNSQLFRKFPLRLFISFLSSFFFHFSHEWIQIKSFSFLNVEAVAKKGETRHDCNQWVICNFAVFDVKLWEISLPFTCHNNHKRRFDLFSFPFIHGLKKISKYFHFWFFIEKEKRFLFLKLFQTHCSPHPTLFRPFDFKIWNLPGNSIPDGEQSDFALCLKCKFNRYFYFYNPRWGWRCCCCFGVCLWSSEATIQFEFSTVKVCCFFFRVEITTSNQIGIGKEGERCGWTDSNEKNFCFRSCWKRTQICGFAQKTSTRKLHWWFCRHVSTMKRGVIRKVSWGKWSESLLEAN